MHARFGGRLLEGIKIHHNHVDGLDSVLGDRGAVRGIGSAMEDPAVNFGVQRLDPAVQHLGEAGDFGNVFDRNAGIAQQLGRAAGGDEFDAHMGELAGEIRQAGLVGHAENGALNFLRHECLGHEDG